MKKRKRHTLVAWKAPPGMLLVTVVVMAALMCTAAYPWIMLCNIAEASEVLADPGTEPTGMRRWVGSFWAESGSLWEMLLKSALPKPLTIQSSSKPIGTLWAESVSYVLSRLHVSDPRLFLAIGIPVLRYTPGVDVDDEGHLPASDPPVPPLIPVLDPSVDPALQAMGWQYQPQVLIYHSHNIESFRPTSGRTHVYDDPEKTIVRVGAHLADELSKFGVKVVHSRADNSSKDYNLAYAASLKTVTAALAANPSTEFVVDLHRDAGPRSATTMVLNGQNIARLYIVVGANEKLGHPNWERNHEFAKKLHAKLEELYPGLSRGILVRETARFNQHVREKALLVEVGGDNNTMDEALRAATCLAKAMTEVAKELQQTQTP